MSTTTRSFAEWTNPSVENHPIFDEKLLKEAEENFEKIHIQKERIG